MSAFSFSFLFFTLLLLLLLLLLFLNDDAASLQRAVVVRFTKG